MARELLGVGAGVGEGRDSGTGLENEAGPASGLATDTRRRVLVVLIEVRLGLS